jgi:hypothetical protein
VRNGEPWPVGGDTAWCERLMLATFGTPVYEDATLIAFRLRPATGATLDAAR